MATKKTNPKKRPLSFAEYVLSDRLAIILIVAVTVILVAAISPFLPERVLSTAVLPLLIGLVILITGSVVTGYLERLFRQQRIKNAAIAAERDDDTPTNRQDMLYLSDEEKRLFIEVLSVDFDYVDKGKISNYYNNFFREKLRLEQVISENLSEVNGEAKGQIPQILESKIGDKSQKKLTSTLKPTEVSIEEMFLSYQREALMRGQVTLGLEKVDIDLSDLNIFDRLISELKTKFNFEVDKTKLNEARVQLRKKAVEKTILRLESRTGHVLMQGKFKITEANDEFYKLTYDHPVNEYIATEDKRIVISLFVRKDSIEVGASGNYAQTIGNSIPIKVYGIVWRNVSRNEDSWELQITPLAIYR